MNLSQSAYDPGDTIDSQLVTDMQLLLFPAIQNKPLVSYTREQLVVVPPLYPSQVEIEAQFIY